MTPENILIRKAVDTDLDDIIEIHQQAFGNKKEAILTSDLIKDPSAQPVVSLLALDGDKAIGHILFTRAQVEDSDELVHILAPLAVIPQSQSQGIGGSLILEGIKKLKEIGSQVVFVLGHKSYYPKYGFIPDAGSFGFPAPYPIPAKDADAWMLQGVVANKLCKGRGKISCADVLDKPEYWRE